MKLSAVLVAALAASTNAIVAFTNSAFVVVPGKPFTLTWSGASGPVTIKLKNGPALVLKDVLTVDCKSAPGGESRKDGQMWLELTVV